MRTVERLKKLKKWVYRELCEGRMMKAPAMPDFDISKITKQEPRVYLAWQPSRPESNYGQADEAASVCPGIIIMPNASRVKDMEKKRFDRYNGIHRPQELGQSLAISMLFSVYEPGVRLPGFVDSIVSDEEGRIIEGPDMGLIKDGTEQGLFTLLDWMDDCIQKLLCLKHIPETDLYVNEASMVYSLYTDQSFVVDKRPIYYGFINLEFGCYAEEGANPEILDHLL